MQSPATRKVVMAQGIYTRPIDDTPIAIIDFETTGLTAGADRVVEVSVVRVDPGQEPRLVFDTLVNPHRRVSATEIHGISDADVADAPSFQDIAGELLAQLNGCVIAAYNVYFDIKFLNFEMQNAGIDHEPPHFCLMYMRPLLGMGARCKLAEACRIHNVDFQSAHVAADDAMASAHLLANYFDEMQQRDIRTFGDMSGLRNYKFFNSFECDPYPEPSAFGLDGCDRLCSRVGHVHKTTVDPERRAIGEYWDTLKSVLADLEITDEELEYVLAERRRLALPKEKVRVLHARAFGSVVTQFCADEWLDDREVKKLHRLWKCLAQLGWAPGE
jgi:DNA polymerase-3 subunit epsilon